MAFSLFHGPLILPRSVSRARTRGICQRALLIHYQITGRFDSELVSLLPRTVKFVSHNGAGYDSIDATACAERGILNSIDSLFGLFSTFRAG